MNAWIDIVNANNDIHKHLNESFLDERIDLDNTNYLNWMNIFNSEMVLSNEFMISHIKNIDWKYLTRVLDESMIERYSYLLRDWNIQLYGRHRTFEFIYMHHSKFDWWKIKQSPPTWFTQTHKMIFLNEIHTHRHADIVNHVNEKKIVIVQLEDISKTPSWTMTVE